MKLSEIFEIYKNPTEENKPFRAMMFDRDISELTNDKDWQEKFVEEDGTSEWD